jgi:hypothetical protein
MVRQKEELKVYLFIHYVTGTSILICSFGLSTSSAGNSK